eukprot:13739093-Alexandrium_andersonii.AAC.1
MFLLATDPAVGGTEEGPTASYLRRLSASGGNSCMSKRGSAKHLPRTSSSPRRANLPQRAQA